MSLKSINYWLSIISCPFLHVLYICAVGFPHFHQSQRICKLFANVQFLYDCISHLLFIGVWWCSKLSAWLLFLMGSALYVIVVFCLCDLIALGNQYIAWLFIFWRQGYLIWLNRCLSRKVWINILRAWRRYCLCGWWVIFTIIWRIRRISWGWICLVVAMKIWKILYYLLLCFWRLLSLSSHCKILLIFVLLLLPWRILVIWVIWHSIIMIVRVWLFLSLCRGSSGWLHSYFRLFNDYICNLVIIICFWSVLSCRDFSLSS